MESLSMFGLDELQSSKLARLERCLLQLVAEACWEMRWFRHPPTKKPGVQRRAFSIRGPPPSACD